MNVNVFPDFKEFLKLSRRGNIIPVYKEISSDLETPVSVFLKLSENSEYACLLESVEGQEKIARYSFIAVDPSMIIKIFGGRFQVLTKGPEGKFSVSKECLLGDPLKEIKSIMSGYRLVNLKGLPRFSGGLVGYLGYDIVRFFESVTGKKYKRDAIADSIFLMADLLVIFDHLNHKLKIVSCVFLKSRGPEAAARAYRRALRQIDIVLLSLKREVKDKDIPCGRKKGKVNFCTPKKTFLNMVKKAKNYIRIGDIIQVVLSRVIWTKVRTDPFTAYRKLRSLNPSAYMFYFKFSDVYLLGSSPEMLVRCDDGIVTTRPIAGTRPRGAGEAEDMRLERELLSDEKERAEHIMLVDLGRNDLGRVCRYGSLKVTEFMRIERYSHVMHIVSEIQGRLQDGKDIYDVLRAAFPAGTVTGSPKVRAMEIIDELESRRRGPYAGCVGYFSFSGNLDTCITIRTILINKGVGYIQAGAGIVADSIPQKEYRETLNKAKAQQEALL